VQRRKSRTKKLLADWMFMRRTLDEAAAIVYSTPAEYDAARSQGIKASSVIISWGINLEPFAALPKRGSFRARFVDGSECPIVLYLGRLAEKKGLDRLLEAFKEVVTACPDARLVIAGEGDPPAYRHLVERCADNEGVRQRILFTGLLCGEKKLAALADANVFVLPSRSENFAVAMFEAMACRLPVVISSGIQLSADIARSGAGLVADDPQAIAAAICRLLWDFDLRRALGERSLAYANQFGWENSAGALTALYHGVLGSERRHNRSLSVDGRWASAVRS
jgi:glycosyltransferase involved in cell wall biosynthesis